MSALASSLKTLSSFIQNHEVSFSNGLLVLLTIGSEQIFRVNTFQCPCSQPDAYYYAVIFFTVPAIVLAILGIIVSNQTWRVFHGCCNRVSSNGFCKTFVYFLLVLSKAAIVPGAWLFITLVDGNYYACMKAELPCKKETDEYKAKIATSQNIGWISLGVFVLLSFIVICFVRCCDTVTYLRYKYMTAYREIELKNLDSMMLDDANSLGKRNIETFLKHDSICENDWDEISKAPDHRLKQKNEVKVFLTPLHKWANRHTVQQQNMGAARQSVGLPEVLSTSAI